jgi:ABC-type multidrug transport system fused ATPase/permease subunit
VLLLAALLFTGIGLDLTFPQIVRHFIDSARAGAADGGSEPVPGSGATLLGAAALYLGVALAAQVVVAAQEYVATDLGQRATNAMRSALTLHCLRLDPAFHHRHTPGELIERIDGDVGLLSTFFSRLVVDFLGNLLLLLGVLVLLFAMDWRLGLAFTTLTLGALALVRALQDVPVPYRRAARQASAEFFGFIEERLGGAEDIRSSGAIGDTLRRFYGRLRHFVARELRGRVVATAVTGATGAVMALATVLVFVLGGWLFARGELTLGTVYLLLAYASQLHTPIRRINRQALELAGATASIVRIQELFDQRSAIRDGRVPLPSGPLSVAFEHVSFAYPEAKNERQTKDEEPAPPALRGAEGSGTRGPKTNRPSSGHSSYVFRPSSALRDVSFTLAPGEVLGLLGRTGSGKTTVSRLLFRLCEPCAPPGSGLPPGSIRLGGVDLRDTRLADLRRRAGLVTQEVQLFHASVRDNLTFFDRSIPDEHILAVLRDLELSSWLETLPAGPDTQLVPGRGSLSAGEAQLLAFARVFLQDPGLVILDEASSRLDPGTERRIERAVDRLLGAGNAGPENDAPDGQRTAIVIAHRLSTIHRADQILILDRGRVLEYGPRIALSHDPSSQFSKLLRTGLGTLQKAKSHL